MRFQVLCLVSLIYFLSTRSAHAEFIVSESFNYAADTTLDLQGTPGTGFIRPWAAGPFNATVSNDLTVRSGSLRYGALNTSGNHVQGTSQSSIAGLRRVFDDIIGDINETIYMSFLIRPESEFTQSDATFNNFLGMTLESELESDPELFVGRPGSANVWAIEQRGGANAVTTSYAPTVGETSLLVLKAEFGATNDRFSLFINPDLSKGEPLIADLINTAINLNTVAGIGLYYTGGFSFDEFRMGESFASVTAVPEPSSLLLTATASVLMLGSRWRRIRKRQTPEEMACEIN